METPNRFGFKSSAAMASFGFEASPSSNVARLEADHAATGSASEAQPAPTKSKFALMAQRRFSCAAAPASSKKKATSSTENHPALANAHLLSPGDEDEAFKPCKEALQEITAPKRLSMAARGRGGHVLPRRMTVCMGGKLKAPEPVACEVQNGVGKPAVDEAAGVKDTEDEEEEFKPSEESLKEITSSSKARRVATRIGKCNNKPSKLRRFTMAAPRRVSRAPEAEAKGTSSSSMKTPKTKHKKKLSADSALSGPRPRSRSRSSSNSNSSSASAHKKTRARVRSNTMTTNSRSTTPSAASSKTPSQASSAASSPGDSDDGAFVKCSASLSEITAGTKAKPASKLKSKLAVRRNTIAAPSRRAHAGAKKTTATAMASRTLKATNERKRQSLAAAKQRSRTLRPPSSVTRASPHHSRTSSGESSDAKNKRSSSGHGQRLSVSVKAKTTKSAAHVALSSDTPRRRRRKNASTAESVIRVQTPIKSPGTKATKATSKTSSSPVEPTRSQVVVSDHPQQEPQQSDEAFELVQEEKMHKQQPSVPSCSPVKKKVLQSPMGKIFSLAARKSAAMQQDARAALQNSQARSGPAVSFSSFQSTLSPIPQSPMMAESRRNEVDDSNDDENSNENDVKVQREPKHESLAQVGSTEEEDEEEEERGEEEEANVARHLADELSSVREEEDGTAEQEQHDGPQDEEDDADQFSSAAPSPEQAPASPLAHTNVILKKVISELQHQLSQTKQQHLQMQEQLREYECIITAKDARIGQLEGVQAKNAELEDRVKKIKSVLDRERKTKREAERQLESSKSEFATERKSYKETILRLQDELDRIRLSNELGISSQQQPKVGRTPVRPSAAPSTISDASSSMVAVAASPALRSIDDEIEMGFEVDATATQFLNAEEADEHDVRAAFDHGLQRQGDHTVPSQRHQTISGMSHTMNRRMATQAAIFNKRASMSSTGIAAAFSQPELRQKAKDKFVSFFTAADEPTQEQAQAQTAHTYTPEKQQQRPANLFSSSRATRAARRSTMTVGVRSQTMPSTDIRRVCVRGVSGIMDRNKMMAKCRRFAQRGQLISVDVEFDPHSCNKVAVIAFSDPSDAAACLADFAEKGEDAQYAARA